MKCITEKISTVMLAVVMAMLIFSACGKTEKSEVEKMQVPSTVDTVCVETVSDTVETVEEPEIELHEFYDIFWPEFVAACKASNIKKINSMLAPKIKLREGREMTKKEFLADTCEREIRYCEETQKEYKIDCGMSCCGYNYSYFFRFINGVDISKYINKENNYYFYRLNIPKEEWCELYYGEFFYSDRHFLDFLENGLRKDGHPKYLAGPVGSIFEKNIYVFQFRVDIRFERYFFGKRNGEYKIIGFDYYNGP